MFIYLFRYRTSFLFYFIFIWLNDLHLTYKHSAQGCSLTDEGNSAQYQSSGALEARCFLNLFFIWLDDSHLTYKHSAQDCSLADEGNSVQYQSSGALETRCFFIYFLFGQMTHILHTSTVRKIARQLTRAILHSTSLAAHLKRGVFLFIFYLVR